MRDKRQRRSDRPQCCAVDARLALPLVPLRAAAATTVAIVVTHTANLHMHDTVVVDN
jgi:hypothetical protein